MRAFYFLLILTLVGCGPSRNDLEAELLSQQPTFARVVDLIEQYRSTKNVYPATLDDVENLTIPEVTLPSRFKSLRTAPVSYEVSRDHSFFRLTYGIYDPDDYELHATSSYLSFDKRWNPWNPRHVERLAHVEATYFGAQYLQNHSRKYLNLAVLSLLDAARANSAYPCRNFWKDWVVEAIGSGQPLSRPLPKLSVVDEAVVYVAENGQAAYAFAFQSRLHHPTDKPLMIVIAVYQIEKGDAEWTLVQQCDSSANH